MVLLQVMPRQRHDFSVYAHKTQPDRLTHNLKTATSLFMIGLVARNTKCPVALFKQQQLRHLMCKGQPG